MVDKVKELGRITGEVISSWGERYNKQEDGYCCPKCNSQIMQTTCCISIHDKRFSDCAGGGEVQRINYPYCPKCDGEFDYARACIHT